MHHHYTWHDYPWPWVSLTLLLCNLELDDIPGTDLKKFTVSFWPIRKEKVSWMYNNIRKHVHQVLVEISADTWPTYMYQPTYPLTFKLPLEWQTCGRNLANQLYWHSVNTTVTWSALVIEFYLMNSTINLFFLAPWISSFMSPVSRGVGDRRHSRKTMLNNSLKCPTVHWYTTDIGLKCCWLLMAT